MKTNPFDKAMKQIENEFENQRVEEIRAARRHELFARIRKVTLVLLLVGSAGAAYAYRTDIKSFVTEKFGKPQDNADSSGNTTPKGAAKVSVTAAQENAKIRDAVVDGVSK